MIPARASSYVEAIVASASVAGSSGFVADRGTGRVSSRPAGEMGPQSAGDMEAFLVEQVSRTSSRSPVRERALTRVIVSGPWRGPSSSLPGSPVTSVTQGAGRYLIVGTAQ